MPIVWAQMWGRVCSSGRRCPGCKGRRSGQERLEQLVGGGGRSWHRGRVTLGWWDWGGGDLGWPQTHRASHGNWGRPLTRRRIPAGWKGMELPWFWGGMGWASRERQDRFGSDKVCCCCAATERWTGFLGRGVSVMNTFFAPLIMINFFVKGWR